MMSANLPKEDLDHILMHTRELWEELRGHRIFISGGTGFFGRWLLESFAWANDHLDLKASAVVLTRNPAAFERSAPHLAGHSCIALHSGDIRSFSYPEGRFRFIIHAATSTHAPSGPDAPFELPDEIVEGTRRALEYARQCGAASFLLTSSGAVYGKQPPEITHLSESFLGAPEPACIRSVYGEGKRMAELLCSLYASRHGLECKIARCFAFVGPHLPLDAHFAIGNFIRDGLLGGPVRVQGDGTPHRSYLYAADLAIWLWTILFRGISRRPYNVGSEADLSIANLAREVALALNPAVPVRIANLSDPAQRPARYVPSTKRAQLELGLREYVPLREAIQRTAAWYGRSQAPSDVVVKI
jgi:dTDP-glucose 4,6-dehydratase